MLLSNYLNSLTHEHIPYPEHTWPRQRPGKDAEKPLSHKEQRFHTLTLQMAIDRWRDLLQKPEQDVAVQLDGFHAGAVVAWDVSKGEKMGIK